MGVGQFFKYRVKHIYEYPSMTTDPGTTLELVPGRGETMIYVYEDVPYKR